MADAPQPQIANMNNQGAQNAPAAPAQAAQAVQVYNDNENDDDSNRDTIICGSSTCKSLKRHYTLVNNSKKCRRCGKFANNVLT